MGVNMNNKKLGIIIGIIGTIGFVIGARSLFNSTYTTIIGDGNAPTAIFLSITPDNPLLLLISLITIVLGMIILLKKRI